MAADRQLRVGRDLLRTIDRPGQKVLHPRRGLDHGVRVHGLEVTIGGGDDELAGLHRDRCADADAEVRAAAALLEGVDLEGMAGPGHVVEARPELAAR